MPTLIRRSADGAFQAVEDDFQLLGEADPLPATGDVILALTRLAREADELEAAGRKLGALLTVADDLAELLPLLPRLSVVAIQFAKFRDGRGFTTAALLRGRHGFTGELRAVGDVLIEAAPQFLRTGFDAFSPADESTAEAWAAKARLHRHVYQAAPDGRAPAYVERGAPATAA